MDFYSPNQTGPVAACPVCGERPGTVRVAFATPSGRAAGTVCEECARRLLPAGAQVAGDQAAAQRPRSQTPALDEFGRDLTADAAAGRIDPVVGRAEEIEQTVEILARRRKNNAVLIGEAGVGKTAIAEGLALRIAYGDVPATLEDSRVVAVDLAGMRAGRQYRGQFEQRLKTALDEAVASDGRVLLFIDELHTILGAGEAAHAWDPAGVSAVPESTTVGEADVAAVVAARTGIPVGELVAGELERLHTLEADLHRRVIGQDEAVELVSDTVRRLIGSPPGYVGYGEGGQLTEPVRRRPYSVILLDEIEKAHPDVWNVLLQVMDDGRLTDGEGRTVDFSNTVLVMTSNLGAAKAKRSVGFTAAAPAADTERMRSAAKAAFLPEFLNRIDEIVTFSPLTAEQVERISALLCAQVADRLRAERRIELEVAEELVSRLAREGFDEEFGARPLKRHIRRTLEKALTRAILDGRLVDGATVRAHEDGDGGIALDVISAPAPAPEREPARA